MVFDLMSCISEGYAFGISVHVVDIATGLSVASVANTVKILCAMLLPIPLNRDSESAYKLWGCGGIFQSKK
jgi:hypothetical protein